MDSIDCLLAIHLPLSSDSEDSSSTTSSTASNNEDHAEDNVNNEDDQVCIKLIHRCLLILRARYGGEPKARSLNVN